MRIFLGVVFTLLALSLLLFGIFFLISVLGAFDQLDTSGPLEILVLVVVFVVPIVVVFDLSITFGRLAMRKLTLPALPSGTAENVRMEPSELPRRLSQRRLFTNITFDFGEDGFKYAFGGVSSAADVFVPYDEVPFEYSTYQERPRILLILGIMVSFLGLFLVLSELAVDELSYATSDLLKLPLGIALLVAYALFRTDFTVYSTHRADVRIIRNSTHAMVNAALVGHRNDWYRRKFGEVDLDNDPANERAKFEELRSLGVLDDVEFAQRMQMLRLVDDESVDTDSPDRLH